MDTLDEFRKLNEAVGSDRATPEERERWARLKEHLIECTRTDVPVGDAVTPRLQEAGREAGVPAVCPDAPGDERFPEGAER